MNDLSKLSAIAVPDILSLDTVLPDEPLLMMGAGPVPNGIQAMGLSLFVAQESRLNSVVGISLPEDLTAREICAHISRVYQVEIAGSFGQPIVRIGQMGEQCRVHNLFRTLHALGSTMRDMGVAVDLPSGMAEMESLLQNAPVT